MNTILYLLLSLILYLFTWFVANLVLYYLSIVFKKPVILQSFHSIAMVFLWLYYTILGIVLFLFAINLLINKQFIWLLIYIFIGGTLISSLFSFLSMPFILIQAYFADKLEKFDFTEKVAVAEILDENNKSIGVSEGNSAITTRLAKYFILFYFSNLIYLSLFPEKDQVNLWGDYLTKPFTQIIGGTLMLGIPYLIYHKIRYKSFFPRDKRYFYIKIWKIWTIIFVIIIPIILISKILFGI